MTWVRLLKRVFAPSGTPCAVAHKLNTEIVAALAQQDIRKRFGDMGLETKSGTSEAFGQFLQSEIKRGSALLTKKP
jgi:tripartite-type tricarboxylate transporter receptor subunit TctC